ncbi:MAG: DUF4157 domain-containing protein, partial [Myxococcota bacterium]
MSYDDKKPRQYKRLSSLSDWKPVGFEKTPRPIYRQESGITGEMVIQHLSKDRAQRGPSETSVAVQRKARDTGLPGDLKAGVETLSGMGMDDVNVQYNSSKPQEVGALAYAQGTNIYLGPGQEKHLPHEAWHVVQQKQGRVNPTIQMKGVGVNDDPSLEYEADVMGARAES